MAGVALAVLVGAVWLGLGRSASPPTADTRPNVLIVLWDTVRADRLSLYGYDRPTTPRLDAFARDAVVYERAISPGIWTLSAHASLFTGLPPQSTGADERWLWLDGTHLTMAEWFGDNGYQTFSFAANTLLSADTNLVQGFDVVMNTWRGKVRALARKATQQKLIARDRSNELTDGWDRPPHGATNAEWARAMYKEAAPLISEAFVRWLDARDDERPFVAYLNFMEAHTPRIPSMAARRAVMDDDELIELGLATDQGHINLHFYNFGKHDYTERELEAINGVYDAALVDLDTATDDLMEDLRSRGILDDTIVVITSDHGENLGDHGLFNHRLAMYDTLLHVPLVIRYPRAMPPQRVARPVSTTDVYGTLLDLAGIPVPSAPLASTSLRQPPGVPGAFSYMSVPLRREILTVQQVHPDVEIEPWLRMGHAIVAGTEKLVRYTNGVTELFDTHADPGELNNLAEARPDRVAELGARLDAWRQAAPVYDPSTRGPDDDPATVRANQQDLIEQLEALGYLQEGDAEGGVESPEP